MSRSGHARALDPGRRSVLQGAARTKRKRQVGAPQLWHSRLVKVVGTNGPSRAAAMSGERPSDRPDTTLAAIAPEVPAPKEPMRRPRQSVACGWCGTVVMVPARGRVPKWCSSSCRHRAWELSRAAASGRAAIQIVDRVVEVDKPVTQFVEVQVSPRGAQWPTALANLASQLGSGRVYDRDLPALADALREVLSALDRRPGWRRRRY